jgi:hypothetical protein
MRAGDEWLEQWLASGANVAALPYPAAAVTADELEVLHKSAVNYSGL